MLVAIRRNKWASLTLLALCQVAAMALWFSATAVLPALIREFQLSSFQQALFTSSVQAGYVIGSLVSTFFGLADRLDARKFFLASALIAAIANASILLTGADSPAVAILRFVTGACMAGIYPVGMKVASSWAKGDMGLLVGLLVGALTLGSASPHLFNALGGIDWRFTIIAASVSAGLGGFGILLVGMGPVFAVPSQFRAGYLAFAWKVKSLRLANLGYLGHMWELFAMWAWIGLFITASFEATFSAEDAPLFSKLLTFATIGIGALGALLGGVMADRWGRTTVTMLAMGISGSCALFIGFLFGGNPILLTLVCLVWGVTVIADSAQFSASVAELSNKELVGTMLTLQTALGFTLTLVTIHLMPAFVETFGWSYAFAPLAIGPFLGVLAMARLRADPDAVRLAGGKR